MTQIMKAQKLLQNQLKTPPSKACSPKVKIQIKVSTGAVARVTLSSPTKASCVPTVTNRKAMMVRVSTSAA